MDGNIEYIYEQLASYAEFIDPVLVGDPGEEYIFYGPIVYDRGALVLHALRLEVGDNNFFDILRTYVERFGGRNAEIADFIAIAEEVSGRDLTGFFDGWLFQVDMPPIPQMGLSSDEVED